LSINIQKVPPNCFEKNYEICNYTCTIEHSVIYFRYIITIEDFVEFQNTANDFLKTMKPLIKQFGSENVLSNSNQSGFQLEIHSGKSNEEVKKVICAIYIINNTLIYHTTNNIVYGNLLSPVFIVLN